MHLAMDLSLGFLLEPFDHLAMDLVLGFLLEPFDRVQRFEKSGDGAARSRGVRQGYFAHEKQPPSRTLQGQQPYTLYPQTLNTEH